MPQTVPRIGITSRRSDSRWIARHIRPYIRAVQAAGGKAVVLAPDLHPSPQNLDTLDGLLLSGGGQVHPVHYQDAGEGGDDDVEDLARDELEFTLIESAMRRDLPILGICRGLQIINVALGGRLIRRVPGHQQRGGGSVSHPVEIAPGSRLSQALAECQTTRVNSRHQQGVEEGMLVSGLRAVAWCGNLIEGLESPLHRWVVAVQWHPERYEEDRHHFTSCEAQHRLFCAFAAMAGSRPPSSDVER